MVWPFHKLSEPMVYLFVDGLGREFVAFQATGSASGGVGMSCGGVGKTQDAPTARRKLGDSRLKGNRFFQTIGNVKIFDFISGNTPHGAALSLIQVDAGVG